MYLSFPLETLGFADMGPTTQGGTPDSGAPDVPSLAGRGELGKSSNMGHARN